MKKSNNFDSLIGCLVEYHGKQYVVKNIIEQSDETVEVITDKKIIRETFRGMGTEITVLQKKDELERSNALVLSVGSQDVSVSKAGEAILKMIEKLSGTECTKDDIERAKAINESAQVLTNMAKVRLDIMRTARDLR